METSKRTSINSSILKATEFLYHDQLPCGGFPNYISSNMKMEKDSRFESCIFSSTIIAYCLGFTRNEKAALMVKRVMEFLINEMIYPGMWRYWSSESSSSIIPDIDDTCCASFLLKNAHPYLSTGKNIPIILNNRNKDGLFYTWINLFPHIEDQNDIDSVVNSNVVFYLGEREETKNTIEFLNKIISENEEEDTYWYYLNNLSLYYMISRAYFNGVESLYQSAYSVIHKVTSKQQNDGSFGDELGTALAVSTLLNFDFNDLSVLMKGIDFLLDTQSDNGMWKKSAFYAGPRYPISHSVWFGAEVLTTALCVETLARFERIIDP